MPTLIRYGPIGMGANIASNVAFEKERQQREEERLRRQRAEEEQRRFEEQMQHRREQDRIQAEMNRRELDIRERSQESLYDWRGDKLGIDAQRVGNMDTPAEKYRRLKEQLISRGDLQGAKLAADREKQEREIEARSGLEGQRQEGRERLQGDRLGWDREKTGMVEAGRNQRHGESIEAANQRAMARAAEREQLLQQREQANIAKAQARDIQSATRAEIAKLQAEARIAHQDLEDLNDHRPHRDDPLELHQQFDGRRRSMEEMVRRTNQALIEAMTRAAQPQPISQNGGQIAQPPTQIAQNAGLLQGGPPAPQPQGPIDPFMQMYNALPVGATYTAPDGTTRIKN